jgi:hypothetical protein
VWDRRVADLGGDEMRKVRGRGPGDGGWEADTHWEGRQIHASGKK